MHFTQKPNSALLIVGHGSTENPDSSTPYFDHADEIRKRGLFAEVHVCFWKEEPSMREALFMIDAPEVYIVPDFISEGYFTQEVIPREFQLDGHTTIRDGKTLHYCLPVGVHPSMTGLILRRAKEVAPEADPADTTLIITGHGTGLNQNSTKAIRDQADLIAASGAGYAHVTDAYMEEQPFIADWDKMADTGNVVVVPFFISDGLHSFQDIPVLLGLEKEVGPAASQTDVFRHNPNRLRGKNLYYSPAIGTEPLMADVILDQVSDFDKKHSPAPPEPNAGIPLAEHLKRLVRSGVHQIGQIAIHRDLCEFPYALYHMDDEDLATQPAFGGLDHHRGPEDARDISTYAEDGEYRFTKGKVNLKRGWIMTLEDETELLRALNQFYPGCAALFLRHRDGALPIENLREKLGRQTGMYRYAGSISDDGAQKLVQKVCGPAHNCAKRILWKIDAETPLEDSEASRFNGIPGGTPESGAIPLLCREACNHFVAECRKAAKAEFDAKSAATAADFSRFDASFSGKCLHIMESIENLIENNAIWADRMRKSDPNFFTRLAGQQSPKYFWIGCSDSRVPANQITGLPPGEVFVHRNVANVVQESDFNVLAVLQYAVDVLKVTNVIVCGHYGCGGVKAALENFRHGLIDNWLAPIRALTRSHKDELAPLEDGAKLDRLCELNVLSQARHVARTTIVEDAWERGQELAIHSWIYRLDQGILTPLRKPIASPTDID